MQDYCPCGCGCRCDNGDVVAPPGTAQELRYSRVGQIFDGSGLAPAAEIDIVVTNTTKYTPWNSGDNGHFAGGTFAQISLLQGMDTTFRYSFVRPGTAEGQVVDFGNPPTPPARPPARPPAHARTHALPLPCRIKPHDLHPSRTSMSTLPLSAPQLSISASSTSTQDPMVQWQRP